MKTYAIILHAPEDPAVVSTVFLRTLHSLIGQTERDFELMMIGEVHENICKMLTDNGISCNYISLTGRQNFGTLLNEAVDRLGAQLILYIDNRETQVILKNACLAAFGYAAKRNPDSVFFYADYDLNTGMETREVKLLDHHIGRVRDNQDYGKVWLFRKPAVKEAGGFDKQLHFHHWYDMRLRLSGMGKLKIIGNKYGGSLYTLYEKSKSQNVFDYLMAGKEVQLEAEKVLTNHLKRINAFLIPGQFRSIEYDHEARSELDASIIIPVGHRPEFIGTAITSIHAQTVQNIEAIIVVNGGRNDPTTDEVRQYMKGGIHYDPSKPEIRLLVIDVNNIGLCLNLGTDMARGKYYVQLDSDDRLKPDAVEKILYVFGSDPNIGMVIGSYEVWEKRDDGELYRMEDIPVVTHEEWTEENGRNNLLRINGAGAPRAIPIALIKAMGYFSVNDDAYARNYGEDYEMVNKIAECFRIGRIYDPIYEVVRHSGGTDHSISREVIDRNDEAKDEMRREALLRRIGFNREGEMERGREGERER